MAGDSLPAQRTRQGFRQRVLGYPPRAVLSALMFLAAMVLERRIRRALRQPAQ